MMLIETIRNIANEVTEVEDITVYNQGGGPFDWTSKVTKNITLSAARLIAIRFTVRANQPDSGLYNSNGSARVLVGTTPLASVRASIFGNGPVSNSATRYLIIRLAAGSYTFDFQVANNGNTGINANTDVMNIYIGSFDLPDAATLTGDSGATVITATTESILLTLSPTVAATRTLAIGSIKNYAALLLVYCEKLNDTQSRMLNAGDSNVADKLNWKIYVDGVQKSWGERENDDGGANLGNYGEGAYGLYVTDFAAGATPTITVRCYNGYGTNQTGRVYAQLVLCPWLLGTANEPINLSFPNGSTLYVILEPLFSDVSKTIQVGKKRGITFGSTNDYYSSSTGTGRISFSYTFDIIDPSGAVVSLTGIGAAISFIGVDVR